MTTDSSSFYTAAAPIRLYAAEIHAVACY
jgi:hypothetical protein